MKKFALATLALAAVALWPMLAQADVLISNLPGNDKVATVLSGSGANQDSKGVGFTLPASSSFVLSDVVLRLSVYVDTVPVVSIYSNNTANNPGTLLQTLVNPAFTTTGVTNYTFTSPTPVSLAAATTYWVVVSNVAPTDNYFLWWGSNPALTPTGIATSAGYRMSKGALPPTDNTTVSSSYAVDVVPEPSTWAVLALGTGLLGVGILRGRTA